LITCFVGTAMLQLLVKVLHRDERSEGAPWV
jgi:hypothetical protein